MAACNSMKAYVLRSHELHRFSLVIIILFFLIIPSVGEVIFNYTSFNPNNHELEYHGDATPSDPVIQLTRNQQDKNSYSSIGQVRYSKAVQLWDNASGNLADFSTHFSFIIDSQGKSDYADGLAFFIAPVGFPVPDAGSGLGVVSGDQIENSTLHPFVAVEFDTFPNPWDPDYDHVGVNINSMISVRNVSWSNRIPYAERNEAWITYNSSTKNLRVNFTAFTGDKVTLQSFNRGVDLRKYLPEWVTLGISAATGDLFEIHTLHSWDFTSDLQTDHGTVMQVSPQPTAAPPIPEPSRATPIPKPSQQKSEKALVGLVIGASATVFMSGFVFLWFLSRKMRNREEKNHVYDTSGYEFEKEAGPKKFSYKELAMATNNFTEDDKVGEGGFGGVYKGYLRETNSYVAVKRVSSGSKQGIKEYASEVKIISQLRHRNLVQLIGWCHEQRELLLVYEFMPNGSLDSHLFKDNTLLTWVMRYTIARGLASALLYLHEEWEQCVLHRDIKSSNIMLDSSFNAKLGDFGLARLVDHGKGSRTTLVAGTMGYMASECIMTGKTSKESDVYSFGVVALEIATGRKPINPMAEEGQVRLVDQVWELYGKSKLVEAADPKLSADFNEKQIERLMIVGLWCAHPDPSFRPSMKQALQVLNFEAPLPNLPSTAPVLTYSVAPVIMYPSWLSNSPNGFTGFEGFPTQSSTSSNNTDSSKLTTSSGASSSATLLYHTQ